MTERTISNLRSLRQWAAFCFSEKTITGDKIYKIGDGKIAFIKEVFNNNTLIGFLLGMFYVGIHRWVFGLP